MKYTEILNTQGITYEELHKKITDYVSKNVSTKSKEKLTLHSIELDNGVKLKIKTKQGTLKNVRKNKFTQKDTLGLSDIRELFDVSFYKGNKKILDNPDEFFEAFNPALRSLSIVYIVGDPLAFDFNAIGTKVKALIASDFIESLLSGVEGTALSTAAIGDANIPFQSIADTFAVVNKYLTDQSERTGTGVQLKEIPYPDVNNTDENSTYQVLATTTGKPVGEENTKGVLQTYKIATGIFFQIFLPVRDSAVNPSPLLYIRTVNNTSVTAWRAIMSKEGIDSLITANTAVLSNKITTLETQTRSVYSVFLAEDTSNGTPITTVSSFYPCYVRGGLLVYSNSSDSGKLYLKNLNDSFNGTAITSDISAFPCYVGDGRIVYRNRSSNGHLYLKYSNDMTNGTRINSVDSWSSCYVGDGRIIYTNYSDGRLYLKSINDTSNGTLINSVDSDYPCYVGGGKIVYNNGSDGLRLYIKNITDTSNGTPINSVLSYQSCYVGGGRIVYRHRSDGDKLYIKTINDTSNGVPITSVSSSSPCYVGGGQIVYRNEADGGKLYIKNIYIYC